MGRLQRWLFPDPVRTVPHARGWNIAFRTAHLMTTGVLLGGHFFDVSEDQLRSWLYGSIVTGLGLVILEAYPSCRWFYQGRGLMILAKLLLLCMIPFWWSLRVPILFVIVVIASVGSHMPSRLRYFSLIHRRILS